MESRHGVSSRAPIYERTRAAAAATAPSPLAIARRLRPRRSESARWRCCSPQWALASQRPERSQSGFDLSLITAGHYAIFLLFTAAPRGADPPQSIAAVREHAQRTVGPRTPHKTPYSCTAVCTRPPRAHTCPAPTAVKLHVCVCIRNTAAWCRRASTDTVARDTCGDPRPPALYSCMGPRRWS